MTIYLTEWEVVGVILFSVALGIGICAYVYKKCTHDPRLERWEQTVQRCVELNHTLKNGVSIWHKETNLQILHFFTDAEFIIPPILALTEPSVEYPGGRTVIIHSSKDVIIQCVSTCKKGNCNERIKSRNSRTFN